jgi:hypothetical protein
MSRVVLTIFCAMQDSEAISTALRDSLHAPVHLRREDVLGRDFGDAEIGERVVGTLARMAVDVEVPDERVMEAVATVTSARRRLPFRWRTTKIADGGRVE